MKVSLDFSCNEIFTLFSVFKKHNYSCRIVGGAVRDAIISMPIKDIDIATEILPDEVSRIFSNLSYKVIPSGINYGTVTVIINNINFEITTLRSDIETDGRYAKVAYTTDYFLDAQRRDFTVNALSYDLDSEELYDYFGGVEDLRNGIIKFIGNPKDRIVEDHLRIVRFYRFSAYYAKELDKNAVAFCKEFSGLIKNLSKERIASEMSKVFSCPRDISFIIDSMDENLILKNLFDRDDIDITGIKNFEKKFWEHTDNYNPINFKNCIEKIRFTCLLFSIGAKDLEKVLRDIRISNKYIDIVLLIYKFIKKIIDLENKADIYFEICKAWYYQPQLIKEFLLISYILEKISDIELSRNINEMEMPPPRMPLNGYDIEKTGFSGLQLRIRKNFLEENWIKSGFSIRKDELLNLKEEKNGNNSKD